MVTDQSDIGNFQFLQNITLPDKFLGDAKIGEIPTMNHKIQIIALIGGFHKIFQLIMPTLGIADKSISDGILFCRLPLYACNITVIDLFCSFNIPIIRMNIEHIAGLQNKQAHQSNYGLRHIPHISNSIIFPRKSKLKKFPFDTKLILVKVRMVGRQVVDISDMAIPEIKSANFKA